MRKKHTIVLFSSSNIKTKNKMGPVNSCCSRPTDDKLMVTKMDLSHCGCIEVPHVVFNAERCIETLILASNQISSLSPQLFHCQEMKHLNLNDNCLSSIPPAIGSFIHLISLKLDKNNLQELPENLKMCKKLKRLSLNSNPWKQVPSIVTQLICLEELYMNDCELNYLPASVGRLSKLKIIELRNNNLCNLPLSMTRLEVLTRLDISDNEFTNFPPCISKFKSLKELLLDNNDIEEIIDIKNLVHLEHLDASYNHIIKVSEAIGCCIHLNMLNLSFNYIEQLPNSIGNITYLQTLHLEMNELTEIPKSIGKLSYLEELNLCNNKLYCLPSTIGLLRNLRNLNVSRNIIEEFPPEIGSCSKLGIINAAYNRLRVLPSEIGYLNNLKVLDLVGNFLMYLPITIINLRGVRAIWLSANQNVPLIPFTEDLNIASGERFLTNIALPQLGEIPLSCGHIPEKKIVTHEKTSTWNKKISFAEDDDILPGKLHRTPTPFPKELRVPNRKHQKNEEPKRNDNYVNLINGLVSEEETPLLPPTSLPITNNGNGGSKISEDCTTQIREANIRRNKKDSPFEIISGNQDGSNMTYLESEYFHESETKHQKQTVAAENELNISERQKMDTPVLKDDLSSVPSLDCDGNVDFIQPRIAAHPASSFSSHQMTEAGVNQDSKYSGDKFSLPRNLSMDGDNSKVSFNNSCNQQVIYSNLLNDDCSRRDTGENGNIGREIPGTNPQMLQEMCQNYINNESANDDRVHCRRDNSNANVENSLKNWYFGKSREQSLARAPSNNSSKEVCKTVYRESPVPPPTSSSANENLSVKYKAVESAQVPLRTIDSICPEPHQPLSKQDFISIAEQMKNRNISPPCYEIAKMYSTRAALFENNRVDHLESN